MAIISRALRQQPRRAVAECTGALLSALQMGGRDTYHFARRLGGSSSILTVGWTLSVYRYKRRRARRCGLHGKGLPRHISNGPDYVPKFDKSCKSVRYFAE